RGEELAPRLYRALEAEIVGDVVRAVAVVIDVQGIEHVVIEGEVVGSRARLLPRYDVHDERHFAVGKRPHQVGCVIAYEGVDVRNVGGRIERHQGRLAVAGGLD